MDNREIGTSGLQVKPFAFGGNVFGWTADEKTSFELLDAFVDKGFNLVDTADVYSYWVPGHKGGESEIIIGNWLKKTGKRDKIVLATKVGKPMGEGLKGLSKAYINSAVEASLKRLQTDYIDLYQSHDDDKDTPLAETMQAFDQLIKEGKVRAIGASNFTADRLAEAIKVSEDNGFAAYQSLQPEYNLYDRAGFEADLKALCLEKNVGVITYYSLASGFLSGKYRSEADLNKSQRGGGIKKYLNDRGYRILEALDEVAANHNVPAATVSIAWLIAQSGITAPIASATSVKQLGDIAKAAELKLSREEVELLTRASNY
ncbi:aldo/keto reductase [Mucilaginibacter sp. UR6-1]|uniref:aldo/keto reductase n=1 Tax=Mucilaginibacter sp. UR6-1 TaxID=1435643 RepID=UPI001E5115E4|nr:aldo/keto reductase [Mucilaginibacter sp. UR6-1]MCC8408086.1 aldo/keto reductase [Mucilaginibacter sp. UR6-1]